MSPVRSNSIERSVSASTGSGISYLLGLRSFVRASVVRSALTVTALSLIAACSAKPKVMNGDEPLDPSDPSAGPTGTMPPAATSGPPPLPPTAMVPSGMPTVDGPVLEDDPDEGKCTAKTCQELGLNCGAASDGCGKVLECGTCAAGQLCGGETPNVCLAPPACVPTTCAELGWACGIAFDSCGNMYDCAAEGRTCAEGEACTAGPDGITFCAATIGGAAGCDLCDALPDCSAAATPTRLTGRVITPGRADDNTPNQVGVPNAFVYIITNNKLEDLPQFEAGIPENGTACDRCGGQDLGPLLVGATTDAIGNFTLEGDIPVGKEFILVVKVGRFRRAIQMTLPQEAACATTPVEPLQTRLPRDMQDGLAVNIPRIAISTGDVDAMECVFEKMGLAHTEFSVPGDGATNPERIHLYGTDGAEMPEGNPDEDLLYDDLLTMTSYDMLVLDCQGLGYLNPPADGALDNVREYVNRGGRMFASHLSFQWICRNGETAYSEADAIATGLGQSADFPDCEGSPDFTNQLPSGTGLVSVGRPNANPAKIDAFAQWLVNENAATEAAAGRFEFQIIEPRELAASVAAFPGSEEFVYLDDDDSIQQYSFNTPYGAPAEAVCGRVAYSGFHVAATEPEEMPDDPDAGVPGGGFGGGMGGDQPFANVTFPDHCEGDLTAQEKVLLYMLFDLGACVGDPPDPPTCDPRVCEDVGAECGLISDGCGAAVDCGPCPPGEVCGVEEPNKCSKCEPIGCEAAPIECGFVGDGCGGQLLCECPPGEQCGVGGPNRCGKLDIAN